MHTNIENYGSDVGFAFFPFHFSHGSVYRFPRQPVHTTMGEMVVCTGCLGNRYYEGQKRLCCHSELGRDFSGSTLALILSGRALYCPTWLGAHSLPRSSCTLCVSFGSRKEAKGAITVTGEQRLNMGC